MKIKVLRHMLVDSNTVPTRPGTVVDVDENLGKELIANGTAEAVSSAAKAERAAAEETAAKAAESEKAASAPANKKAPEPKNKGA